MSSVTNNPRQGWLEYFGLPDDLDEYTLADVRSAVTAYVAPAGGGGNGSGGGEGGDGVSGGSSAPLTQERHVTLADFSDYMQRVGEPYRFMSANRPRDPAAAASAEEEAAAAAAGDGDGSGDLSAIPEVCFAAEFDLSRPETFAYFSPPDQPHAASLITLERLGGYLDTVEIRLLSEVSHRSEGFFEALKSYDALNREVAAGCEQIDTLRGRMRALEQNLVHRSLRLPTLARRRANTAALKEKLRLVHAVWAAQPTIQQLLTARDFPAALEHISTCQQLLATGTTATATARSPARPLTRFSPPPSVLLPARLPACLPACPPACPPVCLPPHLPACPPRPSCALRADRHRKPAQALDVARRNEAAAHLADEQGFAPARAGLLSRRRRPLRPC